jgi:LPXTG-site transpeptidase (sortase) family protein
VSIRSREETKTRRLSPGLLIIILGAIIFIKALHPGPLTQQQGSHSDPIDQSNSKQVLTMLPESPQANRPVTSTIAGSDAPALSSNFTKNQPVRLVISSLGIDTPIQPVGLVPMVEDGERYYQWEVPDGRAVGWHKISARLGESGNTVLNGHNNVYGQVFRDLASLEVGAEIVVYDAEKSHTYIVTQSEIVAEFGQPLAVRLENARWIQPGDEEQITMVSCWPYASNTHRVIVVAKPASKTAS